MTESIRNGLKSGLLPATAAANRMGDLCLGSLPSRAAARSLIAAREGVGQGGVLFRVSVMANPGGRAVTAKSHDQDRL